MHEKLYQPSGAGDSDDDLACSSGVASEASSMRSPRKTILDGVKTDKTHLDSLFGKVFISDLYERER